MSYRLVLARPHTEYMAEVTPLDAMAKARRITMTAPAPAAPSAPTSAPTSIVVAGKTITDKATIARLFKGFQYATQSGPAHRFTGSWDAWLALSKQARAAHKAHVTMDRNPL